MTSSNLAVTRRTSGCMVGAEDRTDRGLSIMSYVGLGHLNSCLWSFWEVNVDLSLPSSNNIFFFARVRLLIGWFVSKITQKLQTIFP